MKCSNCDSDNLEGAVFCSSCGEKLFVEGAYVPSGSPVEESQKTEAFTAAELEPGEGSLQGAIREADQGAAQGAAQAPQFEEEAAPRPPTVEPSSQPTIPLQAVSPESPYRPKHARLEQSERLVCPQCYAENAPVNNFCQECGSQLPSLGAGRPPVTAAPVTVQPTMQIPQVEAGALPAGGVAVAEKPAPKESLKGFGLSDVLAIISLAAVGLAIAPLFKWVRVPIEDIFAFTYHGPRSPGGPGILPFAGWEWLTMGVIVSVAGGIILLFLIMRYGRGPMFLLAGSLLIFPFVFHLTQSLIPLREQGVEFSSSIGFSRLFFGVSGTSYNGLGLPVWLLLGAGILMIIAGFLAPPRVLTRLITFFLFFFAVAGVAVFTAFIYNFNLFIPAVIMAPL